MKIAVMFPRIPYLLCATLLIIVITPLSITLRTGRPYGPSYQPPAGRLYPKSDYPGSTDGVLPSRELLSPTDRLQPKHRLAQPSLRLQPREPKPLQNNKPSPPVFSRPTSFDSSPNDDFPRPFRPPENQPSSSSRDDSHPPSHVDSYNDRRDIGESSSIPDSFSRGSSSDITWDEQEDSAPDPFQRDLLPNNGRPSTSGRYPSTNPSTYGNFRPRKPAFTDEEQSLPSNKTLSPYYSTPAPRQEVTENIRGPSKFQSSERIPSGKPNIGDQEENAFPPAKTTFFFKQYPSSRGTSTSQTSRNPLRRPNRNQQDTTQSSFSTNVRDQDESLSSGASSEDEYSSEPVYRGNSPKLPVSASSSGQARGEDTRRRQAIPSPVVLCPDDAFFCDEVPNYPRELIRKSVDSNRSAINEILERLGDRTRAIPTASSNPDGPGDTERRACDVRTDVLYPKAAKDKSGKWRFIVNEDHLVEQPVKIERCSGKNQSCAGFPDNPASGFRSRCAEKYFSSLLLTFDENDAVPKTEDFYFPVACVCYVGNYLSR